MPDPVEETCLLVPNFGSAFEGMLLACLESVERAAPGTRVYVAWQDMAEDRVAALGRAYPASRWAKCSFAISSDYAVRISAKTLLAEKAAEAAVKEGAARMVLMDSDILMRGRVDDAFTEAFDVGYTEKPERWPLNSGVIFLRAAKAGEFLRLWAEESRRIATTPELLAESSSKERPFGGIDQMALYEMADYGGDKTGGVGPIRYAPLPCSLYNETRSLPLPCPARMIHYKGAWHRILTKGAWYSSKRPMKESLEMHRFYLETALAGLARVNAAAGRSWTLSEWNLRVPAYLDSATLQPVAGRVLRQKLLAPFREGKSLLKQFLAKALRRK